MDNQRLFSSSQDLLDPDEAIDPMIVGGFDQGFDDFMFSDAGFLDNVFGSSMDLLPPDVDGEGSRKGNADEGTSSGTGMGPKRDRSKTLVSERRRRSRMKEKLYELRSLVPNITKVSFDIFGRWPVAARYDLRYCIFTGNGKFVVQMDKASIIGDAVVYVQTLQDQERELRNEISVLESPSSSSPRGDRAFGVPAENLEAKQDVECRKNQCRGKILSVMAHEVGEGRFSVRVECGRGDGVASALYSAVESLKHCFHAESSGFSFASDRRLVLALSLNVRVRGSGEAMTASSMKLWVMGALLKEGFAFEMMQSN